MDPILDGTFVVCELLKRIDHPISGFLLDDIRQGQIRTYDLSPDQFSLHSWKVCQQALALIKKNPWIFPESDIADATALEKFLSAETKCAETNRVFKPYGFEDVHVILSLAKSYCSKILGPFRFGKCDFGPGSSFSITGKSVNLVNKLRTPMECTPQAHHYLFEVIMNDYPHIALSSGMINRDKGSLDVVSTRFPLVSGNRLCFVPKTSTESRPICIEPAGNLFLQKGIGDRIRSRLREWGHDIGSFHLDGIVSERQLIHRDMARLASINGDYATIDLSSASDTISTEFVRFMLPFDWFYNLEKLRSHTTTLPCGKSISNEKFSSMGNGFTFELETLLFYSLVLATRQFLNNQKYRVSVYGDDIICDTATATELVKVLSFCGFTTNQSKSFLNGPFRESCGGDFYTGIDVRPVFIRQPLPRYYEKNGKKIYAKFETIAWYVQLSNVVIDILSSLHSHSVVPLSWRRIWSFLIHRIPKEFRVFGSDELKHDVLWLPSNDREFQHSSVIRDGVRYQKRISRFYRTRVKPCGMSHELAYALYRGDSGGVTLRNSPYGLRIRQTATRKPRHSLWWVS